MYSFLIIVNMYTNKANDLWLFSEISLQDLIAVMKDKGFSRLMYDIVLLSYVQLVILGCR